MALALGVRFFEVMNGHRGVRNEGDATHPSVEALWDVVLARRLRDLGGPPLLGLASDDAHHYFLGANGVAAPGRGWVVVRAEALTPDAITRALLEGDFYASTGVRLTDVRAGPRGPGAFRHCPEPGRDVHDALRGHAARGRGGGRAGRGGRPRARLRLHGMSSTCGRW